MSRTKFIILIIGVLLAGVLIFWYTQSDRHDWNESYIENDKEPYGGFVLSEILKRSRSQTDQFYTISDTIYKQINLDTLGKHDNYVFLGRHLYLDSTETSFLLDFVKKGNHAYIISQNFNSILLDTLIEFESEHWEYADPWEEWEYPIGNIRDSVIYSSLEKTQNFPARWVRYNKVYPHSWRYFKEGITPKIETKVEFLGDFADEFQYPHNNSLLNEGRRFTNYIRVKWGKGYFYLHTNPELFTNYNLRRKEGFEYCQEVFKSLKKDRILWDEDNRRYQPAPGNETESNGSLYEADEGVLSFILGERELRIAWYTLFLAAFLFFLFGARRLQRIIPVVPKNKNTSIEYSETVGQMYMKKKDHRPLVKLKMNLFLAFLRERYHLKSAWEDQDELKILTRKLALKSKIPEEKIKDIFSTYQQANITFKVDTELLVQFHRKLEYFYNNCK